MRINTTGEGEREDGANNDDDDDDNVDIEGPVDFTLKSELCTTVMSPTSSSVMGVSPTPNAAGNDPNAPTTPTPNLTEMAAIFAAFNPPGNEGGGHHSQVRLEMIFLETIFTRVGGV